MAKSTKAVWWALFAGGGSFATLLPVLIIITGVIVPLELAGDDPLMFAKVHAAMSHWLVKLVFFAVIALSFFHCAHRFFHTLVDVGFKSAATVLSLLCYGGAIAGTVITAIILWNI